jgi:23S rRNA G2445 N2-methylase RlmL
MDATAISPPEGGDAGWVVSNPPYGLRTGDAGDGALREMVVRFGTTLRSHFADWRIALLSASTGLDRRLRLPLEERLTFLNGGLRVRLLVGRVPGTQR